ncbi:MAG TPA: TetR/AcrR family transcriptional regulator [Gemmataceae bacterium]|nr:TetR/AcrR family transcriptional regulator [Gemmataceae bacterium]
MRTAKPVRSEHILEAAARLFGERPYHEVRMEDIAAKAGVSKGGIYLKFKDKEDLYLALILHSLQRLHQAVQSMIAPLHSPEEKLATVVREGMRFFHKAPYFLELIQRMDVSRSAAHTAALNSNRKQFINLLIDILGELNASGHWAARDPELAALALTGMIREALRWRDDDPERLADELVQLFLHGISKP